jgi:hypothetical protein
MMKVGFICEGLTEQQLVQSIQFQAFLVSIGIETTRVINADGNGNLLPNNIGSFIEILNGLESEVIIILTDLDKDKCITSTKKRMGATPKNIVIVAVKTIEAWFLACTSTMQQFFSDENFFFEFPENESEPFETIRQLRIVKTNRGFSAGAGGKRKLIYNLLQLGLAIDEAAKHPNCPSAAYFIDKLWSLSKQTR